MPISAVHPRRRSFPDWQESPGALLVDLAGVTLIRIDIGLVTLHHPLGTSGRSMLRYCTPLFPPAR